jgi:hypothetical protein
MKESVKFLLTEGKKEDEHLLAYSKVQTCLDLLVLDVSLITRASWTEW